MQMQSSVEAAWVEREPVWVKRLFAVLSILILSVSALTLAMGLGKFGLSMLEDAGYGAFSLTGKSMEPHSYEGDLLLVELGHDADVGDCIIFWRGEGADAHTVFHRVTGIDYAEGTGYYTKGDNNASADSGSAAYRSVVGKEVAVVPHMGFLAPGSVVTDRALIACGLLGILAGFFLVNLAMGRLAFVRRPGEADGDGVLCA